MRERGPRSLIEYAFASNLAIAGKGPGNVDLRT
jgi:hypothetical protein